MRQVESNYVVRSVVLQMQFERAESSHRLTRREGHQKERVNKANASAIDGAVVVVVAPRSWLSVSIFRLAKTVCIFERHALKYAAKEKGICISASSAAVDSLHYRHCPGDAIGNNNTELEVLD